MAGPEMPDIDPSVEEYFQDVFEDMTDKVMYSRSFGDDIFIERPRTDILPGETAIDAHKRLQKKGPTKQPNDSL